MTFHVGQKVVCVDDQNFRNPDHIGTPIAPTAPVRGTVYHVRSFSPSGNVLLAEIVCAPHAWEWGYGEGGWLPRRFRPVTERKTDISIFTAMLTPNRERERA